MLESGSRVSLLVIVHLLELGRRHVADRFQQPLVIEPVHPLQGGDLHVGSASPWTQVVNYLRLVEPMIVSASASS